MISLICGIEKKRYKWIYLQNRNRPKGMENKLMVTRKERGGREKLGGWGYQIHCDVLCLVTQSCPTLCDPTDCSPSGSSVRGIFLARLLEWVDIYSSRGSSWPKNQTGIFCVSGTGRGILFHWATRKLLVTIRLFSMSAHLFMFCK